MNRDKLVKAVAKASGYKAENISEVFKALEDVVIETVAQEDEVKLFKGFSIVGVRQAEATRRNPQNGQPVVVPEHIKVKAKITDYFKGKVNE